MTEEKLKKTALYGISISVILVLFWFFFKFLFPVFLPFLLSYCISLAVLPMAEWLFKKTKISKKVWAVIIITVLSFLITLIIWKSATLLIKELGEALSFITDALTDRKSGISKTISKIADFAGNFAQGVDISTYIKDAISGATGKISGFITDTAGAVIAWAPGVVFTVIVSLISLFYFALDGESIKSDVKKYIPDNIYMTFEKVKNSAINAVKIFIRAYFNIMCITFAELLIGFLIIGVDYAFLSAILVAIVDVLPVFGTGTVLVPWSIILFVGGDTGKAVAMLSLFAVMYVVRQFIEPKIVGNFAGVHPILALVSVYVGFKLCGVGGMILGPVLLNGFSSFWSEKVDKN